MYLNNIIKLQIINQSNEAKYQKYFEFYVNDWLLKYFHLKNTESLSCINTQIGY